MTILTQVLLGAVVMGDAIGDRLFLFFAASFAADAVSRVVVDEYVPPFGYEPLGYMIRILSYLFIIVGILYKNTSAKTTGSAAPPRHPALPREYLR
ncbi:MAG TPA: DUF5985 family protein [Nitrospira sp.]|nr:DUF5985 family protein [Nitrospira sp.]